jgi:hypothetical protein
MFLYLLTAVHRLIGRPKSQINSQQQVKDMYSNTRYTTDVAK